MEARIIELETRIAYQEQLIQELNEVVTRQQNQIDALRADYERILAHLKAGDGDHIATADEECPPPHY